MRKCGHDWLSRTAAWVFAAYGKSCRLSYIAKMLWCERSSRGTIVGSRGLALCRSPECGVTPRAFIARSINCKKNSNIANMR